jgi:hypothetical protein
MPLRSGQAFAPARRLGHIPNRARAQRSRKPMVTSQKGPKVLACDRSDRTGGNSLCGDLIRASRKGRSKSKRFARKGYSKDHSLTRARIQGELHLSRQEKEDVIRHLLFDKQSGS